MVKTIFKRIITMKNKFLCLCLTATVLSGALTGCGGSGSVNESTKPEDYLKDTNPVVTMTVKDFGTMKLELFPDVAPESVNNFISLANQGYYNGTTFHRIIARFMIQGGDPTGTGAGGPGYCIKGEFSSNGHENNISHVRGVLSMARAPRPDSAGSQFFIVHKNSPHLDGDYAAFGFLIEGTDVLDAIANTSVSGSSPIEPVVIESVTVDTKGVEYPEPNKL